MQINFVLEETKPEAPLCTPNVLQPLKEPLESEPVTGSADKFAPMLAWILNVGEKIPPVLKGEKTQTP